MLTGLVKRQLWPHSWFHIQKPEMHDFSFRTIHL